VLTFLAPNSLPCADSAVKNLLTHSLTHSLAYDVVLKNVSGVLESRGKVLEIFVTKRVGTL